MSKNSNEVKKFTGYHATIMIVSFFAVVITVNMIMARFALSTFSGTVVDNSYVASQKYNDWLKQARDQKAYGWTISPALRKSGKASIAITTKDGLPLDDMSMTAVAEHPIGQADPFELNFVQADTGEYHSTRTLPAGRWKLKIIITQGDKSMRVVRDIW